MKIRDLTATEFRARIQEGLPIRTGPYQFSLRTRLHDVSDAVRLLYADFPVVERPEFVDFHVQVCRSLRVDRWLKPLATFVIDGVALFRHFPRSTAPACLEWGMNRGIAVRMDNVLVLHAAVLERGGRSVVLLGESGAGKSTLCAAMTLRGWRLLSDELALISPHDGTIAALSRPVILKNDAIRLIRDFAPGACIGPEIPGTSKGTIAHLRPPAESVARSNEPADPGLFLFVNYQPQAAARLVPVSKARGHLRIAQSSFNYGYLGQVGFETLADAVERSSIYELTYGDLTEAIELIGRTHAAG